MPDIFLYDSLTKKKQKFIPSTPQQVKMYACGVTTYDDIHLGHVRSAVFAELVRKVFLTNGYRVKFVKNFTNIDDKIITRANATKVHWYDLSEKMIESHDSDLNSLNLANPDIAPKATDYIPDMLEIIKTLIDKGFAYQSGTDVFYRAHKFEGYGQLSGKNIDDLIAGHRVEINEQKENPLDFALWKGAKEGEPYFESQFGNGRPGWHIECSAMIHKCLSETIDIHIGGSDLIFPHHENEIAQSQAAFGKHLSNYWLHHAMVLLENHKMSKSLGNFINAKNLLASYHPELIKFFLLQTHYHKILNFNTMAIEKAAAGLDRIYMSLVDYSPANADPIAINQFMQELNDNFNSPKALAVIFDWVKAINKNGPAKTALQNSLITALNILNLGHSNPNNWFSKSRIFKADQISEEEIAELIVKRKKARDDKNWAQSDEIRDYLKSKGVEIKDFAGNTSWQRIN